MATNETGTVAALVAANEAAILPEWLGLQKKSGVLYGALAKPSSTLNRRISFICSATPCARAQAA